MYYRYTEFPQFHIQSPLNRKAIRIQASKVNGRSSSNNNSNIPPILKSAIIRLTALYTILLRPSANFDQRKVSWETWPHFAIILTPGSTLLLDSGVLPL